MIVSADWPGLAFGTAAAGDVRGDAADRARVARTLDIPPDWCWLRQVHGVTVLRADVAGVLGEGDAAYTTVARLPIAVATADCYPVVLQAPGAVGIAHAGWRGTAGGVVTRLRRVMAAAGHAPVRAAVGPGIGACCFEVGDDVCDAFAGFAAETAWGTRSIDLVAALKAQLGGLVLWDATACTMSDPGFHSFRRDGTARRQVSVAWLQA